MNSLPELSLPNFSFNTSNPFKSEDSVPNKELNCDSQFEHSWNSQAQQLDVPNPEYLPAPVMAVNQIANIFLSTPLKPKPPCEKNEIVRKHDSSDGLNLQNKPELHLQPVPLAVKSPEMNKKKRRLKYSDTVDKICRLCKVIESPEWRKGPVEDRRPVLFCNACWFWYNRNLLELQKINLEEVAQKRLAKISLKASTQGSVNKPQSSLMRGQERKVQIPKIEELLFRFKLTPMATYNPPINLKSLTPALTLESQPSELYKMKITNLLN